MRQYVHTCGMHTRCQAATEFSVLFVLVRLTCCVDCRKQANGWCCGLCKRQEGWVTENGCERWEGGGGMTKGLGYTGKKNHSTMTYDVCTFSYASSWCIYCQIKFRVLILTSKRENFKGSRQSQASLFLFLSPSLVLHVKACKFFPLKLFGFP